MHLKAVAERAPDRAAIIMGRTGAVTTFRQLDERSTRLAHLLRSRGLGPGASIAIFAENHPRFLEVAWAAQRSGLRYTAINSHLTAAEAAYIADDCDALAVVSTMAMAAVAAEAFSADTTPKVVTRLMLDDDVDGGEGALPAGWESYESATRAMPTEPIVDEMEGDFLLYSSGTTGRPKGIKRPLALGVPLGEGTAVNLIGFIRALGVDDGDVYLTPAPLYHAAPLAWSMSAQRLGATVVVMERFDPSACLTLIARHRVTHGQFVPTMFVRMLKLADDERDAADLSSLRKVIHAAAPCPVAVKQAMIDWWGPILDEYYSATEGLGLTYITSPEWLAHPGSVGRAMLGVPSILDDDGNELPVGEVGTVWFSGGNTFEYHNDPAKTAEARDSSGRATVGDVGYLDADGYLYLTDRKTFMIISGGVNIYPQESENVLIGHPEVADVAVIGVPDEDLGEAVKAVVQLTDPTSSSLALEQTLLSYCRERLSGYKCPKSIDFVTELPRLDTGKLYKKQLRSQYWPG
jgi:long-chain acyl-CoA synthetase